MNSIKVISVLIELSDGVVIRRLEGRFDWTVDGPVFPRHLRMMADIARACREADDEGPEPRQR